MIYRRFDKNGYEIKGWNYMGARVWRIFSMPAARALSKTKMRPEHIVGLSFIFAMISVSFFIFGKNYATQLGGIFFAISWLLDHVDGDLARVKSLVSKRGEWLDSLAGKLITPIIYLSICINSARSVNPVRVWIIGYLLISGYYVFSMLENKVKSMKKQSHNANSTKKVDTINRNIFGMIIHELCYSNNVLYFILIFGALANKLYAMLLVSVIYVWFFSLATIYMTYKEVKSMELKHE